MTDPPNIEPRSLVPFPVLDTSSWEIVAPEPMGQADKVWLAEESEGRPRWLFKPVQLQHDPHGDFIRGTDWAEKIAAELAALVGIPAARVELAEHNGQRGSVSLDVTQRGRLALTHGNDLISTLDPDYQTGAMHKVERYNLDAIFKVLNGMDGPPGVPVGMTAKEAFAGYLVLDAWVANQDRHHANWAVLDASPGVAGPRRLAPSFDHASSLGFQLSDRSRQAHLDREGLERWAAKAKCRTMEAKPRLDALAADAVAVAGPQAAIWRGRLEAVDAEGVDAVIGRVPSERLSQVASTFIVELLDINRRRLLDAL